MSNQLIGKSMTRKGTSAVIIKGDPPLDGGTAYVSVNVKSHKNRKTDAALIDKHLANGFDWNKWTNPLVGKLPDETMWLYDGDHRRHIWKKAFPNRNEMPVTLRAVSSKQEMSSLWVALNRDNRKTATSDEVFVHEVLAKEPAALKIEKIMKKCQLSVSLGTGEEGTQVGAISQPFVMVPADAFKRLLRTTSEAAVIPAALLLQEVYPNEKKVNPDLFRALTHVYHHIPSLNPAVLSSDKSGPGKRIEIWELFSKWLKSTQHVFGIPKDLKNHCENCAPAHGKLQAHVRPSAIAVGMLAAFKQSPVARSRQKTISKLLSAEAGYRKMLEDIGSR